MAEVRIQIERVRPKPARPTGNSETRYRVLYKGREIGVWRVPSCSAARWLLDHGEAIREDTLRIYRGEQPSMTGGVGWFADRTVTESDTQGGTPRFVRWKPMGDGLAALRGAVRGSASGDLEEE